MAVKSSSKYPYYQYWRYLVVIVLIIVAFHTFYGSDWNTLPRQLSTSTASTALAHQVPARTLLSRPLARDRTSIPKLIHQTWFPAGTNMSERAQDWVQTIRSQNPDWEYILWDDETNRMLVEQYFPWFLPYYMALPKEILRADVVRNFYMYTFGGMYADVDTEALRPVEPLFTGHATSLAAHQAVTSGPSRSPESIQRAFLGRMSHSDDIQSAAAVPNGWMASPPGHPFWLLPILHILKHPEGTGDGSVEGITGPGALSMVIEMYYDQFKNYSAKRYACDTIQDWHPEWHLFCDHGEQYVPHGQDMRDALVLLPQKQIYPYSWADDKESVCLGASSNPKFDPDECKRIMDVDAWPSYFITYCTHTWG